LIPAVALAAPSCSVSSAGGLRFGTYDLATDLDSTMTVRVRCPKTLVPQVLLDKGTAPTYFSRILRSGAEQLGYNVFLNAARTQIWGDGSPGTFVWMGGGGNESFSAFGRIPAGQDVAAGSYSDTLILTVLF
jgi:spore coat protein U-like protein